MSPILTVVLIIAIVVLSVIAVFSVFVLINFFDFERPFAEELIRKGIGEAALKSAVVKKRFLRGALFFLVGALGALGLITQVGGIGGAACIVTVVLCLLFLRPNRAMYSRSDFNIASFYDSYKDLLNTGKFLSAYPETAKILKQQGKA